MSLLGSPMALSNKTVLLTSDTALSIKGLAEGLEVSEAAPFYNSFMSPYGTRYIYGSRKIPTSTTTTGAMHQKHVSSMV